MSNRTCTICSKIEQPRRFKRGMCGACYQRWRYHGHVTSPPPSQTELFWSRVQKADGCWNWTGTIQPSGYGVFGGHGPEALHGEHMAHRIAYVDSRGPIPDGLVLDHLCRNRACVNPRHLQPVTQQTNILRGEGPSALNARKDRCDRGHEFDRPRKGNHRACSQCQAIYDAAHWEKTRGDRPRRFKYDGQQCSEPGCERVAHARGLCHTCYVRERNRQKRAA